MWKPGDNKLDELNRMIKFLKGDLKLLCPRKPKQRERTNTKQ